MDIVKELAKVNSSKKFGEEVVNGLISEFKELQHKIYLFQIVVMANKIEDAVAKGIFSKTKFIDIDIVIEDGGSHRVVYDLLDKNKEFIEPYNKNGEDTKQAKLLNKLVDKIEGFSAEQINPKLNENIILELKLGIKEKIFDLFLSKELKSIYDYNQMQLELSNGQESNTKRPKI
jgi:hypothetical protein